MHLDWTQRLYKQFTKRLVQGQVGIVLADHPIALTEGVTDPDPAVAKRVFDAMMTMKKIEAAQRG